MSTKLLMQVSKGNVFVKIHDTPISRDTPVTHR